MYIELKPETGDDVKKVIAEAIRLAFIFQIRVKLTFNRWTYIVDKTSSPDMVYQDWHNF